MTLQDALHEYASDRRKAWLRPFMRYAVTTPANSNCRPDPVCKARTFDPPLIGARQLIQSKVKSDNPVVRTSNVGGVCPNASPTTVSGESA